jgi:hypothetical protein
MPDLLRSALRVLPIALLFSSAAPAASFDDKLQALRAASVTAGQICTTVPLAQRSSTVALSGGAQTYLSKFVSWLAKIKISAAANYQGTSSQGVLQKDLARSIRESNDCKRAVFNKLMDKLIADNAAASAPSAAPPTPSPTKAAPAAKPDPAKAKPAPAKLSLSPAHAYPTAFDKPNGQFVKKGQFWIETPEYAPGQNFAFTELGHDQSYVYLVDRSRAAPGTTDDPMVVRLPIHGGWAQWTYQSPPDWKNFIVVEPTGLK